MNTSAIRTTPFDPTFLLRSALERIRLLEAEVLRLQSKSTHGERVIRVFHFGRWIRVPLASVCYLKAESNYTRIYLMDGEQYFVSRTLKSWMDEICEAGFMRCHRSYLVNRNEIREISRTTGILCLKNGSMIPVSRRFHRTSINAIFEVVPLPGHVSTAKPDCTVHKLGQKDAKSLSYF
jgi:two-component system LytT family response regulator